MKRITNADRLEELRMSGLWVETELMFKRPLFFHQRLIIQPKKEVYEEIDRSIRARRQKA